MTSEFLTPSKEERSHHRKIQLAYNNSPEAKRMGEEILESLRHEQELDRELGVKSDLVGVS